MNVNLIHTWLKDPRFAPTPEVDEPTPGIEFLPIEIEESASAPVLDDVRELGSAVSVQRVDISLSDGRRILVEGPTALSGVLALVDGLMR